jgi:hypothetical protein
MRTEILVTAGAVIALSVVAGCVVGYRKGAEWGVSIAAAGVILAFLFPWGVLFR